MTWRHPVYPVNDKSTPDNMICQNCGVQSDCHVRPVKRADDSWSECADFPAPGFPKYLERVDWNFNVQLEEQRKRIDFVSRERDTLKEQMHQVSSWNMKLQAERELLCAEKAELSRQRDAARASVCNHDTTEITQLRARKEMDRQAIEALMAGQRGVGRQIALLKEIKGQLKLGNQMLLNDSQNKIDAVAERTEQRDMARNSLAVWVQREADAQREIARLREVCCRPLPPVTASLTLDGKEIIEAVRLAVEASLGGPRATWQPIATAPKNNGDEVLLLWGADKETEATITIGCWGVNTKRWIDQSAEPLLAPEYWMPLPEAPK